jgi:hypothetical protein
VQVEVEEQAFAATWVDETSGEIVGTTLGETMCWRPNRPWALTIMREGDQLIAPCGECPGCLEFLRRRLAERLHRKYGPGAVQSASRSTTTGEQPAGAVTTKPTALWIVRIWYPLPLQADLAHKLHRRKGLELEAGFYRLGVDSFVVLARSKQELPRVLRRLGLRHRVEPVRLSRGRRAWRTLTAGILVARAVYGEQVKRWYARGLPPAERLRWDVVKRAMQKPWRRRTGARVRTGSRIILVPPAIWSMDGDRIKEYRAAAATASSPEEAIANRRRLAEIVAGAASHLILDAPAQPALSREAVQRFYAGMAARSNKGATETSAAALNPSTLLGGGLRSCVHSGSIAQPQNDLEALEKWLHSGAPPPQMGREREYEDWLGECWSDGRTRRAIIEARMLEERAKHVDQDKSKFELERAAWLERMKSKIRGG